MEMSNPHFPSAMGARQSFFQVMKESIGQTRFQGHDGCYEWLRMPMDYSGSPAVYTRVMHNIRHDLPVDPDTGQPFWKVYIDDI